MSDPAPDAPPPAPPAPPEPPAAVLCPVCGTMVTDPQCPVDGWTVIHG